MSQRNTRIWVWIVFAIPLSVCAQNQYPHFTHITTRDGLTSNNVYSIFQDRTGFIWLGSYNCLTRYDGYTFKHYQHDASDSNSFPAGVTNSISQDVNGDLWLVDMLGNLRKFNTKTETLSVVRYEEPDKEVSKDDRATAVLCDTKGNIWVIRQNKTVRRLNLPSGKWYSYSFADCSDICLLESSKGDLWCGLYKYNPETDRFEKPCFLKGEEFFRRKAFQNMVEGKNGDFWIISTITTDCFLLHYDVHSGELKLKSKSQSGMGYLTSDRVHNIIWYAMESGGVKRLNVETGQIDEFNAEFQNENTLSHGTMHALYCDRQGNFWAATDKALDKLTPLSQVFKQYRLDPTGKKGLAQPITRCMYMDSANNLWVGTRGGGMTKISFGKTVKYKQILLEPKANFYGSNFVNYISPYKDNMLLVATNTGVYIYDWKREHIVKHIKVYNKESSPKPDRSPVWSVLADTGNIIWIGTYAKGIFMYNTVSEQMTPVTIPIEHMDAGAGGSTVWNLIRDKKGNLWACTHYGIVKIWRDKENKLALKLYGTEPGGPDAYRGEDVWDILEDENGIFWIAGFGAGLHRFDPVTGKFKNYTVKNGLPSNEICGILEDDNGLLWVSTIKGLFTFNKEKEQALNTYYEDDGLQSDHFGFHVTAKSPSGELFFGGQNGFNSFMPQDILHTGDRPRVALTEFRNLYEDKTKALLQDSFQELPYEQSSISFDFAVMDLSNPKRNIYKYYLEGVDSSWSLPTSIHSVNYNFLPPGRYVFHVMGATGTLAWSDPISFSIVIKPPFWRRWWFILSAAAFAAGVVWLLLYSSLRQQREKRKRLESELATLRAQLNPHFIFNSLSSLQNFITENKQFLALEYLSKFATLIRMILQNSRHTFISLAEEIRFLELYTYMEAVRYQNKIAFHTHVETGLDTDKLKILPMIVQPLIENSIKHGLLGTRQPGRVDIYFRADANYIYCVVEDNGIGLTQAEENKKQRSLSFPSISTGLIRERLVELKDRKGNRGSLRISDINDDGKINGVRAELRIPLHSEIHEKIPA